MLGCLGHCVFLLLHLAAVLFGLVGLIVTVPAHLIFMAVLRR